MKVWKSPEDLPRVIGRGLCDLSSRRIRWGLCVWDWVSSSLNTQPLQPDVQLRQQSELAYQMIVFTKLTGSISSTLSFPHNCVVCLFIYVFEDFDWRLSQFPQFNFLSSISSVCLSSSSVILCLRFRYFVLMLISSWWLCLCSVMFTFEYLFRC